MQRKLPLEWSVGLTIKNYSDLKVGDIVEAYEIEEVKRTL
jgi:translation initiation factor IF-2